MGTSRTAASLSLIKCLYQINCYIPSCCLATVDMERGDVAVGSFTNCDSIWASDVMGICEGGRCE